MKKDTVLIAMILICGVITGCGDKKRAEQVATSQPQIVVENNTVNDSNSDSGEIDGLDAINAIGDVEVDKGLFDVEFTVPKDLVGDVTQEELEKKANEKGYKSITLNADGSATYKMTKSQHKEMMEETKKSLDDQLAEMAGPSSDYPNFVEIKANDDYTSFTIVTKADSVKMDEAMSVLGLYMYGGMYNIFNGTPVENIHVEFINEATGQVIESSDSNEMGKD